MYTLILTKEERKAINWVGHRYWNGDDLMDLLQDGGVIATAEWDYDGEITFIIPEGIAWDIRSKWEENDESFPCFDNTLSAKLLKFLEEIV